MLTLFIKSAPKIVLHVLMQAHSTITTVLEPHADGFSPEFATHGSHGLQTT